METIQWRILRQLPDLRTDIVDRLATDADFRALCRDYDDCAAALDIFRTTATTVPERVTEYERLLNALEHDIQRAIDHV